VKNAENIKMHTYKNHKANAQRRGEDAILREKVRKDYQTLMQNLNHLAQEERKLKACQIQSNMVNISHVICMCIFILNNVKKYFLYLKNSISIYNY
jgi:hypothetical protein